MRRHALLFALLYTAVILYLCFYPGNFSLFPKPFGIQWVPVQGRRQILDAALNVVFYVPLGFSLGLGLGRRGWRLVVATLLGSALAMGVEYFQLWTPNRYSNYNDWLMNSIGTAIGSVFALVTPGEQDQAYRRWTARWQLSRVGVVFMGLWLIWCAFPFVPKISLPDAIRQLRQPEPWSMLRFGAAVVGAASLREIVGRSPWMWVAFAIVPAQWVIMDRGLSPSWVAGAALGWMVVAFAPAVRRYLGWALLAWLVDEQFRPWVVTAEPKPFSWVPFLAFYEIDRAYAVIFGKLYLYTATPLLLRRGGLSWMWAVSLPLVVIAAGEWTQRYLPGRTPELTDILMLLAGALLVRVVDDEPKPQNK